MTFQFSFFCWFLLLQLEACAHPFFDELRETNARLPNGRPLPPLFNFKQEVCYALKKSESHSWGLYGRHVMHFGDHDTCCHASHNTEI